MKVLKVLGKPFTALAGKIDHTIEQKILMSIARKAVMALGTYLITTGYLDMGHLAEFVGAVLTLISIFSGTKAQQLLAEP